MIQYKPCLNSKPCKIKSSSALHGFSNGFSRPKPFRDFRETDPSFRYWGGLLVFVSFNMNHCVFVFLLMLNSLRRLKKANLLFIFSSFGICPFIEQNKNANPLDIGFFIFADYSSKNRQQSFCKRIPRLNKDFTNSKVGVALQVKRLQKNRYKEKNTFA